MSRIAAQTIDTIRVATCVWPSFEKRSIQIFINTEINKSKEPPRKHNIYTLGILKAPVYVFSLIPNNKLSCDVSTCTAEPVRNPLTSGSLKYEVTNPS